MENISVVDEERTLAVEAEPDRLDPSTFGLLYERHRVAVYRYLRARTRRRSGPMPSMGLMAPWRTW